jgi:hypothetical protein
MAAYLAAWPETWLLGARLRLFRDHLSHADFPALRSSVATKDLLGTLFVDKFPQCGMASLAMSLSA